MNGIILGSVLTSVLKHVACTGQPGTAVFLKRKNGVIYPLVLQHIHGKSTINIEVLMGKSTIDGPFSMAMLNNQRVPEMK